MVILSGRGPEPGPGLFTHEGRCMMPAGSEEKKIWELTRSEFVDSDQLGAFVKYKGKQNLAGFLYGGTVYPLKEDEQHRGRLLKTPAEIKGRIHAAAVEGRYKMVLQGRLPNALPYQKKSGIVPWSVLKDYPDLLQNFLRPWQMTIAEFMSYHVTGRIPSSAYEGYRTIEGLDWLKEEKYPLLYSTIEFGEETIEFRKTGEKNSYVKCDINGEIVRDGEGLVTYLTDDEVRAKGLALEDQTIVAFNSNGKAIGFASNEFGTTGIWVVEEYQKQGVGTYLLDEFRKTMPSRSRMGQATGAGENLLLSWHRKQVLHAIEAGYGVPDIVLKDYLEITKGLDEMKKNPVNRICGQDR